MIPESTSGAAESPIRSVGPVRALIQRFQMAHGRKLVIAMPYLWLFLLFMLPFLIVFKISLAEMVRAVPPLYRSHHLAGRQAGYLAKSG